MASTTTKAKPKAPAVDPFAAATTEVSLPRLKKPPKKADLRRIGIVPDDVATLSEDSVTQFTELRADLRLPPNAGETDLNVTFHGGAIASGVAVELIFWGSAWQQPANSALRAQFVASAASLIGGPYYTALKEYGAAKPTFRGAVTVISPNPPGLVRRRRCRRPRLELHRREHLPRAGRSRRTDLLCRRDGARHVVWPGRSTRGPQLAPRLRLPVRLGHGVGRLDRLRQPQHAHARIRP